MSLDRSVVEELTQRLQGSCGDLASELEELGFSEDDMSMENYTQLELEIFLCSTCGWWCEICQEADDGVSGEQTCEDCHEEED